MEEGYFDDFPPEIIKEFNLKVSNKPNKRQKVSENEEKTTPVPQNDEGIQAEDDKKPEEPPAVIEATVEAISHVPVA